MNELEWAQTVAAEEEWLYEQEQRRLMGVQQVEQAKDQKKVIRPPVSDDFFDGV